MKWLLLLPFILQGIVILIDEFHFHWQRDLPLIERIGHPLDVCTLIACFGWLATNPFTHDNLIIYIGLSIFSCIFVTKEEWVHFRVCTPGEQWIHSLLFLLQPMALISAGIIWALSSSPSAQSQSTWHAAADEIKLLIPIQIGLQFAFLVYQLVYWGFIRKLSAHNKAQKLYSNQTHSGLVDSEY